MRRGAVYWGLGCGGVARQVLGLEAARAGGSFRRGGAVWSAGGTTGPLRRARGGAYCVQLLSPPPAAAPQPCPTQPARPTHTLARPLPCSAAGNGSNLSVQAEASDSDAGSSTARTATLLVKCPDQKGVVASLAQLLYGFGCNILSSDQFSDVLDNMFYQVCARAQNDPVSHDSTVHCSSCGAGINLWQRAAPLGCEAGGRCGVKPLGPCTGVHCRVQPSCKHAQAYTGRVVGRERGGKKAPPQLPPAIHATTPPPPPSSPWHAAHHV